MSEAKKIGRNEGNRRLIFILCGIGLFMFGFGYLLVPIYNTMCKTLSINGKTGGAVTYDASHAVIDKSRTIRIEFLATNNDNLPWSFYPKQKKITLHPGEMRRIAFFGGNDSNHPMVVQAIPSVTPSIAARYLKKTECFCFTQQKLAGHESMDMPILFHIDPAIPKDIHTVTLSYTLFDVTAKHLKDGDNARHIS